MDKAETNGYLRAIENQLRSLEEALQEIDRAGDLNDRAYEDFRKFRIEFTNLSISLITVRGWNH